MSGASAVATCTDRRLMHVRVDSAHDYERGEQGEENHRDALAGISGAALVGFDAQRSEVRFYRCVRHSCSSQANPVFPLWYIQRHNCPRRGAFPLICCDASSDPAQAQRLFGRPYGGFTRTTGPSQEAVKRTGLPVERAWRMGTTQPRITGTISSTGGRLGV